MGLNEAAYVWTSCHSLGGEITYQEKNATVKQTVHIAVNAADQKPIWLNDLPITFDFLSILPSQC